MPDKHDEEFSMLDLRNQTAADRDYAHRMEGFFDTSLGSNMDKLRNFAKFVPRQSLSSFLAKYELFKEVLPVHGHIVECGVFLGGGLMTWANLSAIFEPVNHTRRIIGFDTFIGFPDIDERDRSETNVPEYTHAGGLATRAYDDIHQAVELFDLNRAIGHIPRVELVVGDANETIPQYIEDNPHLVVAMLYLDFDLYEPTKKALEGFLPRMPKGAVIAFDELNQAGWPGETLAVLDAYGIRNLRIQRFPFTPQLSYAILD